MHLQAAWAHFVDEGVLPDRWLAGMVEPPQCLRQSRRNKNSARSLPRNPVGPLARDSSARSTRRTCAAKRCAPSSTVSRYPWDGAWGSATPIGRRSPPGRGSLPRRRVAARGAGGGVTAMRMLAAAPGYFAGTITSRSLPDSAAQASPARPSICRTSAPRRSEAKLSNFSVAGSNLTIALIDQSVSQTLS